MCHLALARQQGYTPPITPPSHQGLPLIETGLPVAKWITGRIYTPLLYQGDKDIKPRQNQGDISNQDYAALGL